MSRVMSGLVVLLVLLAGAGCGNDSGPNVATLTPRLEAVDAAAVADDPEQLGSAVRSLLRVVEDAEAAGDISAAHADRIQAAAGALLEAAAPVGRRAPQEPAESTRPAFPPTNDDEDEDEDSDDETAQGGPPDTGKDEDKGKGKGKGKGKDE